MTTEILIAIDQPNNDRKPKMATEAYKEGKFIKHLTTEQLLRSRDVLQAELKKAEETVASTRTRQSFNVPGYLVRP
jgi:hypothetical protein